MFTLTKLGSSAGTSLWNSSLLSVSEEPSLPAYALNWDTSTPIADSMTAPGTENFFLTSLSNSSISFSKSLSSPSASPTPSATSSRTSPKSLANSLKLVWSCAKTPSLKNSPASAPSSSLTDSSTPASSALARTASNSGKATGVSPSARAHASTEPHCGAALGLCCRRRLCWSQYSGRSRGARRYPAESCTLFSSWPPGGDVMRSSAAGAASLAAGAASLAAGAASLAAKRNTKEPLKETSFSSALARPPRLSAHFSARPPPNPRESENESGSGPDSPVPSGRPSDWLSASLPATELSETSKEEKMTKKGHENKLEEAIRTAAPCTDHHSIFTGSSSKDPEL
ncbi:hypothetical protein EYF80_014121 [Liparis tanakae]|uniref:Uncharacterized protein n=1 Tax=Liparis tanakae TaxID=230148 RepID=A0A4Z2ICQ4_9TELE|nr:hypothetical protein EYF80_014121 [Liparis tanakae]